MKKSLNIIIFIFLLVSFPSGVSGDVLFPMRELTAENRQFVLEQAEKSEKEYNIAYFDQIYNSDPRQVGDIILDLAILLWADDTSKNLDRLEQWCARAIEIPEWGNNKDLPISHLLFGLSVAYNWHQSRLDPDLNGRLRAFIYSHGQTLFQFAKLGKGWWVNSYWQNHCWINYTGLLAAGMALSDDYPETIAWVELAQDKLKRVLWLQPPFGSNHEGIDYSVYGNIWLVRGLSLLEIKTPGIFNQDTYLKNYYKYFKAYSVDGTFETFFNTGDSKKLLSHNPAEIFLKLYRAYSDEEYQRLYLFYIHQYQGKYQSKNPSLMAAVYGILKEKEPSSVRLATHDFFPDLGIYIEKAFDDPKVNTSFLFKSGIPGGRFAHEKTQKDKSLRLNRSHSHPDQNHFMIWIPQGFLIADSGYPKKNKSTKQENTLLIDGVGQLGEGQKWFDEKKLNNETFSKEAGLTEDRILTSESVSIVSAEAAEFYPKDLGLKIFNRKIVWIKSIGFFIFDSIGMDKSAKGEIIFHSDFNFKKAEENTYWFENEGSKIGKFLLIKPAQARMIVEGHTHIHKHEESPRGQMLSVSQQLPEGVSFFITGILSKTFKPTPELQEDDQKMVLRVTTSEESYLLAFNKVPGQIMTIEDFTTDAKMLILQLSKNKAVYAYIFRGKNLKAGDKILWQNEKLENTVVPIHE